MKFDEKNKITFNIYCTSRNIDVQINCHEREALVPVQPDDSLTPNSDKQMEGVVDSFTSEQEADSSLKKNLFH